MKMKQKTKFGICWKHEEHGSDRLDVDFKTVKAAEKFIEQISADPVRFGMVEWLRDAALWVVDDEGNLQ